MQVIRDTVLASGDYNILMTTFEFAMRDKKFLRKINWEYVIVDEAHRLKNPKCKLVKDLNKHYGGQRRLALTGRQHCIDTFCLFSQIVHPRRGMMLSLS